MTYLELCQQVHRLLRPGDGDAGTVPSALTGQTGILGEIVYWVQKAWLDVQNEESEWRWMVLQGSLSVTLASGRTYAMSSFTTSESATAERCLPIKQRDGYAYGLIYLTSDGVGYQQPIPYVPYEDWRGVFDRGTRPSGKPQRWTIKDSMRVEFDPTPDATYTFTCDVKVIAQTLATGTNSDLANYPTTARGLPAQYHDVVVWRAVKYYALTRQELSNLYQMADREERRILEKMRRDFTPEMYLDESIYDFGGF